MGLFSRVKRLWELSGTISPVEDAKNAEKIKEESTFYRKMQSAKRAHKGQRLATIIMNNDPFEGIPKDDDTTNK